MKEEVVSFTKDETDKFNFLFDNHLQDLKEIFRNDKALTNMLFDMVNDYINKKK